MQLAIVEFARNKAGLDNANSSEFNKKTKHPVIALITEWQTKDGTVEVKLTIPKEVLQNEDVLKNLAAGFGITNPTR